MGLRTNYNYKISFTQGRFYTREIYENILTEDQLKEVPESIDKEFIISNVYNKIGLFSGNKEKIEIRLDTYRDDSKTICITSNSYNFIPKLESEDNFIKQGYEYLKTLEQYINAEDC